MNGWLLDLNAAAPSVLLDHVWPMLWQSSLLIVLVALAGRTIFRKASPQFRYALWGLVLIRLVVPPGVDLPTALGHWGMPEVRDHLATYVPLDAAAPAVTAVLRRPLGGGTPPVQSNPVDLSGADAAVVATADPPAAWSLASMVIACWGAGVMFLLLLLLVRLVRMHRDMQRGSAAPAWVGALIDDVRFTLRVRWPVRVRIVAGTHSPALVGLRHPTILLPRRTLNALNEVQLRAVLAHEIAHVKRLDFVVNWVQVLLGIVYFCHPFLWYANREMRRERELACDDLTLISLGLNRDGYAQSLLRVAEGLSTMRRVTAPLQVGVMEGELELAQRLRRILDQKIRPVPRLTVLSLGLVIGFAAVFGTWHTSESEVNAAATDERLERRVLNVKVVDEAGDPVAGAIVTPTFLRTSADPGSSYGWRTDFGEPTPAETNADGVAALRYPRYVMERMETNVVAVIPRHPAYASAPQIELSVDGSSPPVVLESGATLRVGGYFEEAPNITVPVHGLLSGTSQGAWQTLDDNGIQRGDLVAGPQCVLLVHEADDGGLYFSEAHEFEARKGVVREFMLPLQRGVTLTGRLDDSVPRPVKNGWVEIRIRPAFQAGAGKSPQGSVEWTAQAEVNADGTFTVENLPTGHGEITAACDGAVSMGERGPGLVDFFGAPVVATLVRESNAVDVPMVASATAVVHMTGPDGNPVAGATVVFWPNVQYFQQYSTIFGRAPFVSAEGLRLTLEEKRAQWRRAESNFSGTSDETGTATITNLPPWASEFTVRDDSLELSPDEQKRRRRPIELHPGETTEISIALVVKGAELIGADTETATIVPALEKPMSAGLSPRIPLLGSH